MRSTFLQCMTAALLLSVGAPAQEVYQPPVYDITIPPEVKVAPPGFNLDLEGLPEAPVTIEEAVAFGLTHHENITEARAEVAQAVARIAQARASALPDVGASASYVEPLYFYTAGGGFGDISSIPGLGNLGGGALNLFNQAAQGPQGGLEVRQLLFDFNRTRSAVKAAEARTRAAEAGVEKAKHELGFEIARAYLEFLQSRRLAEVRLLNAENQSAHVDEARRLHATGLGLPIDAVRAQTEYATAVYDFVEARNQALLDRVELATFMGLDPRTPFEVKPPEVRPAVEMDLEKLVEKALNDRPAIAESLAQVEAQKFTLDNKRAGNQPRLSTSLKFQANRVTPQPQTDQLNLMLNLEWPIFNGGLTLAEAREAEGALTAVEAQLRRLRRQVISDVTLAFVKLETAEQNQGTARVAVEGAEESVRVANGRYRLGLAGFIEVLDAEDALLTARTDQVNARAKLEQAYAELRLATGQPWD